MEIDPEALSRRDLHRLLSGIVAPRPMSWVTSVSTADVVHAARLGVVRSAPDRRVTNGDSGHPRTGAKRSEAARRLRNRPLAAALRRPERTSRGAISG
jgi:hypothetical protein